MATKRSMATDEDQHVPPARTAEGGSASGSPSASRSGTIFGMPVFPTKSRPFRPRLRDLGALLGFLLGFQACADERVAGGNSSGTSNTLAGRLVDSSGAGVEGMHVVARRLGWSSDPDRSASNQVRYALSDSTGRFSFEDLPPDAWVVEANDGRWGHLFGSAISGTTSTPLDLGSRIVGRNQALRGRIRIDSLSRADSGQVRISGTPHVTRLDSTGAFRFDRIPPGTAHLVVEVFEGARVLRAESTATIDGSTDSVVLLATSGESEDYSTWKGARTAIVDLASPESYLSSTQDHVPILVRLDATILPEWDAQGASIRFSNAAGNPLPYEIESWNPSTKEALAWVLMDTLPKGSQRQRLRLHWGKPGAPSRSHGASVFEPRRGWLGSWHFSGNDPWRNSSGRPANFDDPQAMVSRSLGGGLVLDSARRLVFPDPALTTVTGLSILAMVKLDAVAVPRATLFRLGAADSSSFDWAMSVYDSSNILKASFATRLQSGSPTPPATTAPIPRSTWTLLGGVFDITTQRVRLELPDDSSRTALARDTMRVRNPAPALVVGGGIGGVVDELRFLRFPMHPDFLRAQWLSWNPSSRMLRW